MDKKQAAHDSEQQKNVREGFGDDMGTRVGRPDAASADDRSMARLSEDSAARGIEGSILDASAGSEGAHGKRSTTRADGSSMTGETNDHAQRGQSGMGAEGAESVHGAQIQRGTDEESGNRAGSEPLSDRDNTHKPSYGGEGGGSRTSSDQRE